MDLKAQEKKIRDEIKSREYIVRAHFDQYTPSGKLRSCPMYVADIKNSYLGVCKTIKAKTENELHTIANIQFGKWEDQEIRKRLQEFKEDVSDKTEGDNVQLLEERQGLANILKATLDVDDRIDWEEMKDKSTFKNFFYIKQPGKTPILPSPTFFQKIFPFTYKRIREDYLIDLKKWNEEVEKIEREREIYRKEYEKEREIFLKNQQKQNVKIDDFKARFENGDEKAIIEYINSVFERSEYPDCFFIEYFPMYDVASKTLIVDMNIPTQDKISKIKEYKYQKNSSERKEVLLKDKEHNQIYDQAVKQAVLRTIHEVFEAVYTDAIEAVVVNAWVEYIDPATGQDKTSCIVSVSANRQEFKAIKLDRIEVDACIKSLKGLIAGPISDLAPVKPIMQLNRKDSRFVESREQLAYLDASTNLAEMHWEDFEHLIRELFTKMFSVEGAEVRVTQASSDGGVDAIAFDPDPIRGGKFVIQAKRYTKTVGVSAVRDLYGTMISEGAVKGILVSTATFGRDSREFVKDKPISLIDGSNLVYLLEEHGYKVKIDLKEARKNMSLSIK